MPSFLHEVATAVFKVKFSEYEPSVFSVKFDEFEPAVFNVKFGEFFDSPENKHAIYDGNYQVDPKFNAVVLETNNKLMEDDVTVLPIYVSHVENQSGGNTVYIGGIFNG